MSAPSSPTPSTSTRASTRASTRVRANTAAAVLALALPLAACGDDGGSSDSGGGGGEDQTLTLLAAASLTEVYATLGDAFEEQNPGVEVEATFGSSTDLAEQAADGAPGDVLSTADETSMGVAEDAGVVTDPEVFATNTIVLAVPAGNPGDITSLDDLQGSTWVRCADEVPCGRVALQVLEANEVTAEPASLEEDVKSALEKVSSGEADAALVYASDAVAAGDAIETFEVPGAEDALTSYYLGALEESEDPELAQAWVDLVTSQEGQSALRDAGFTAP